MCVQGGLYYVGIEESRTMLRHYRLEVCRRHGGGAAARRGVELCTHTMRLKSQRCYARLFEAEGGVKGT